MTVPCVSAATQVWAGGYADYVRLSNGTVDSWGDNTYGQLGDATKTGRAAPVQVSGLTGVASLGGRDFVAYAIMPDGSLDSWGSAVPYFTTTVPVAVTGLEKMRGVNGVGGKFGSLAAFQDGSAAAFQP